MPMKYRSLNEGSTWSRRRPAGSGDDLHVGNEIFSSTGRMTTARIGSTLTAPSAAKETQKTH